MAKKTPNNNKKAVEETGLTEAVRAAETKNVEKAGTQPQKPAALTDSKSAQPKKAKKTPAKKQSDKPNIFKRMWKGIKGTFSELKKVTWPKGKDVLKSTSVVIAVVCAFFVVLFGIDYVLSGLLHLVVDGSWASFI